VSVPTIMNSCPSTVTLLPCTGSTSVLKPKPMVMDTVCPAKVSASKAKAITMPMPTPIRISCTAVNRPAPEKIDKFVGLGAIGANKNASDRPKINLTRLGMVISLATGAAMMNPPMRRLGHHTRPTQIDTSAALNVIGCAMRISR